jgi:hypothetical protein
LDDLGFFVSGSFFPNLRVLGGRRFSPFRGDPDDGSSQYSSDNTPAAGGNHANRQTQVVG